MDGAPRVGVRAANGLAVETSIEPLIREGTASQSAPLPIFATLNQHYPGEIVVPQNVAAIPNNQYFVYILALNDAAIVVGHGRKNRARVIFDGLGQTTVHFKAILVRLHHLYAPPGSIFMRYLIKCASKVEATQREHARHALIGGNVPKVPE